MQVKFFYMVNGARTKGPYSLEDLAKLYRSAVINDDTTLMPDLKPGETFLQFKGGEPAYITLRTLKLSLFEYEQKMFDDPTEGPQATAQAASQKEDKPDAASLAELEKLLQQDKQDQDTRNLQPRLKEQLARCCDAFVRLEAEVKKAVNIAHAASDPAKANALSAMLADIQLKGLALITMHGDGITIRDFSTALKAAYDKGIRDTKDGKVVATNSFLDWLTKTDLTVTAGNS